MPEYLFMADILTCQSRSTDMAINVTMDPF